MNKLLTSKFLVPALHVAVWLMLFSLPYLLSSGQGNSALQGVLRHLWIPLGLYGLAFYLNYLWLADRLLFARRTWLFVGINIAVIAAFLWFKFYLQDTVLADDFEKRPDMPPKRFFVYLDTLSFVIPILFAIGLRIFERWKESQTEKKDLENLRLASELQHLKYQLQPHFFFNSLNNIYSLVDISPEKAKETIHSLGILMRYLLYDTNVALVPLRKELEFMRKYVELMRLRTSEKTTVSVDFLNTDSDIRVAPLLFISLIENAFKHGVSAIDASDIRFSLQADAGVVTFRSENADHHTNAQDRSGSGIGLHNLEKRLELIYPGQHEFRYGSQSGIFVTELILNTNASHHG